MSEFMKTYAEKRLSITRETELLQSFVRVNVTENDLSENEAEEKDEVQKTEETDTKSKQTIPDETTKKLSKQFVEESKKKGRRRRRRNGPKYEEIYCDKDRAAAVNLGSKDIKHSLRLKRKQDRSKALQIPEEAEPGTFLALGNYEMCRGDIRIAIGFISKALELNPNEKNALVARSKCYILLGQPKNALEDAELALKIDKNFIKAIYQKAEALYYLGDFELSLVFYHRGLHVRPDHEGFKLGVQKAQNAIENAIGSFATFKGINKSLTSVNEEEKRNDSKTSKGSGKSTSVGSYASKKTRLLRELEVDKEYLDHLMNNPDIKCKFKQKNDSIERCIKDTVDYLTERQEFWRQQLPPRYK
ncbi:outer dynein arm-docking complex subunit 4 [Diorhabda sublineata]|uniref:outer dynein arm-docking complex subunit 4 n=1 Tax=Diorhabda sublineata TaxID=1163346 RepID=UPI0024E113FB|nr:outer dynein arm-docking complex subunit 4 [Diorhabda sublineata]